MAGLQQETHVCVTGASGFIGGHIVAQLLDEGYKVKGTVRSLQDEKKLSALKSLQEKHPGQLELVEADLTKPESWEETVKGCQFVMHVACPFPSKEPSNPDDIIKPAVDGTLNVLKACAASKTVRRVVLTSSIAAVCGGLTSDEGKIYTEADWTNAESDPSVPTYQKAKTLAEKAAWDFMKDLKEEEKFDLTVINPGFVMGPIMTTTEFTSDGPVKRMMQGKMPMVPNLTFACVDVRDVAQAHLKAMTVPDAAGKRFLLVGENKSFKEIAEALKKEFKPQGYFISTLVAPKLFVWMQGIVDKTAKIVVPHLGKVWTYNNDAMKTTLGITPTPIDTTVVDMAYSMVELGVVKKSKKFVSPHGGADATKDVEGVAPTQPEVVKSHPHDDIPLIEDDECLKKTNDVDSNIAAATA